MVTTVAPTMTVRAASKAPTKIIEMLKQPLIFLNASTIFVGRFVAIPDFYKKFTIKIDREQTNKIRLIINQNIINGIRIKLKR